MRTGLLIYAIAGTCARLTSYDSGVIKPAMPAIPARRNKKPSPARPRRTAASRKSATKTAGAYKAGAKGVHIFPLRKLGRLAAGGKPGDRHYYADTRAAVVEGERMQVGLAFEKRGCGSAPHSHPNEQFNFILQGKVRVKIGRSKAMIVPQGSVVHFPANVVHSQVALPEEDVVFYVVKDLAHGIVGIPAGSGKATNPPRRAKPRKP